MDNVSFLKVSKKKDLLLKLEKVVTAARETQPRYIIYRI